MSTRVTRKREIEYPESDGKPMAEGDAHRVAICDNIQRLKDFFAGRRVYVSGVLLVYYEEGKPRKRVAPDTFVIKDCDPGPRRNFKIWVEGRGPNFVLETTSQDTRREDEGKKKKLYAQLGVGEYILFDPLAEWLTPPLQGHRLLNGQYHQIEPAPDGSILSHELGIRFTLENGRLAMYDAATGERLLTNEEMLEKAMRCAAELQAGGSTTP